MLHRPWGQLAADVALWIAFVGILLLFRALLVGIFHQKLPANVSSESLLRCFVTGLKFDISVATYALLPSLVFSLAGLFLPLRNWPERVRTALTASIVAVFTIAFVADVAYFAEYGDQFNHWIFGLIYDDRRAIGLTIWKQYPVVTLTVATTVAVALAARLANKLWRTVSQARFLPDESGTLARRAGGCLVAVTIAFIALRGSLGRRPVQQKDAATTGDVFLNKLVLNPLSALRYAIAEHRVMYSSAGLQTFLPDGDVRAAAAALFPQRANATNLDACLERVAPGAAREKPKHVFIVMMESYDSWAMQPKYASLHLTDRLAALGREGVQVWPFVSAGDGTIKSLGAVLCGLPYAGVFVNYQPEVRKGVRTAPAGIFKRLGYRPRFFYSGYLSWQRVGDFAREQGFEDVFGGDQMSAKLTGDEWGVDDATLFRFVLEHTSDEPTFNVLMSTSYHPPFSVDLEAAGFDVNTLKTNALCRELPADRLRVLGHLWYSDKCLVDFVQAAETKLTRPLFALTGDHYSRVCIAPRPTLFEETAVPLVIFGRQMLAGSPRAPNLAGSHIDILPTLINFIAPPGFTYHAFGRDLFDTTQPQLGFGCDTVVGSDFILKQKSAQRLEQLDGSAPLVRISVEELALRYRRLHALSWWRAMKGNDWPALASVRQ